MKTLLTALTAAVLLAGAGAASALDQQTTNTELDNIANHAFTVSRDNASARVTGAYASARVPHAYASTRMESPVVTRDFQLDGGRN